jgi:hypothetical protein
MIQAVYSSPTFLALPYTVSCILLARFLDVPYAGRIGSPRGSCTDKR